MNTQKIMLAPTERLVARSAHLAAEVARHGRWEDRLERNRILSELQRRK